MKRETQGMIGWFLVQVLFVVFFLGCAKTSKPIKVAVTGDSLASRILVEELEKVFPEEFEFEHYGTGGANIYEMENRTRISLDVKVPGRLGCDEYDWVIYWIGVNDYKSPEVELNLKDFYLTAKTAGVDNVIAITIPPYGDYHTWTPERARYSGYLNRMFSNYSDNVLWSGDVLATWNNMNKMKKKYTTDGLHLTREGCRVIAEKLSSITIHPGNKKHD